MGSLRSTTAAAPTPTLGDQQLVDLGKQLLAYAHRYVRAVGLSTNRHETMVNANTLEDIVEECVLTLIDPESERHWNPDKSPEPLRHLISVFNSKLYRARQDELVHRGILEAQEPVVPSGIQPSPETYLLMSRRAKMAEKARELLLEHIINDKALLDMYDAIESGLEKPAEIAERMGVEVAVVYNLSKRLDRLYEKLAPQIRAELQLDGESDG